MNRASSHRDVSRQPSQPSEAARERADCINSVDIFSQAPLATIPNRYFVRTDDGYGHDVRQLAHYMHDALANPATRKRLTAADIERMMRTCAKGQVLHAAVSHRTRAIEAFGAGDYTKALRHCDDAVALKAEGWALWFVRIDSLTALGRFEEARLQTTKLAGQSDVPWALQVRQHGLNMRLDGCAAPVADPPGDASLEAIKCATVFCLHCRCATLAQRLSLRALQRAPHDPTIKQLCAVSATL